jgi:calcineurin-like phosphoesterase family protein
MIWFTSDTHFDHANILKYTNRPWKSVEDMNEGLIATWNAVVQRGDVVYHLGDFAFRRHAYFASRLNGHINLIEGSHDKMSGKDKKAFTILGPMHTVSGDPDIIICHYAMRVWPRSHYGTWHLYGHSHGSLPPHGHSLDVGVDPMGYVPVSLEKVSVMMEAIGTPPQVDPRYQAIKEEEA